MHNPFKALGSKSTENITSRNSDGTTSDSLAPPNTDSSRLRSLGGFCCRYVVARDGVLGLTWTDSEVLIFQFRIDEGALDHSFMHVQPEGVGKIMEVQFVNNQTIVVLGSVARGYKLISVDANMTQNDSENARLHPMPTRTIPLGSPSAVSIINTTKEIITLRHTSSGRKEVSLFSPLESQDRIYHRLWCSQLAITSHPEIDATLTAVLLLEFNSVIFGYSDGRLRHTSFSALAIIRSKLPSESPPSSSIHPINIPLFQNASNIPIPPSICSLHLIRNERTGDRFSIGGSDDSGITVWTLRDLKLCASFVQFIAPLLHVVQVRQQEEHAGPLHGCVLCISMDGTIAVMAVDEFELLYVLPGASSPLSSIHYGGGEEHDLLMVLYVDGSARLWDIKTGEFRCAMDTEKSRDAPDTSGWFELPIDSRNTHICPSISAFANAFATVDSNAKASGNTPTPSMTHSSPLTHLRTLLSIMLTPGLSPDIDEVCEMKLGITFNTGGVGHVSSQATTLCNYQNIKSAWCISGVVSASRAIAIIAILKTMSLYEDELRHAARILFDAGIVKLSDEESTALVDAWQHHLIVYNPVSIKTRSSPEWRSLFAVTWQIEKYSLLSTSALVDISKSISLYLHDNTSNHRTLAIDLCAKGFHIWQHYVNSMSLLRALFGLATNMRKEQISVQNVDAVLDTVTEILGHVVKTYVPPLDHIPPFLPPTNKLIPIASPFGQLPHH
ncbi:hypothetical protein J3R83DRAFT_5527 [Lanmaoa asiatica]|nr:hypothetical protein J3R83DRAFT_5527 [Lanmaoa asiatica]